MITSLLREELGLGYVSTVEVSPDGKTVYFGRYQSYDHDRMNLGVISLGTDGQPIGDIKYFRDCTEPLQAAGGQLKNTGRSSVVKIVFDSSLPTKKLYLVTVANGFQRQSHAPERSHLSIYDLDSDGVPISNSLVSFLSPISSNGNNIHSLYSFESKH